MDIDGAVRSLAALAQDSRLALYQQLVQAGPAGVAAGELAGRLGIPANTLSFHLRTLNHAGLVGARHEGRYTHYSANYAQMHALVAFLTRNCCGGRSCAPAATSRRRRRRA